MRLGFQLIHDPLTGLLIQGLLVIAQFLSHFQFLFPFSSSICGFLGLSHGVVGHADGLEASSFEHLSLPFGFGLGGEFGVSSSLGLDFGKVGLSKVRDGLFVEGAVGVVDLGEEAGVWLR